MAQILLSRPRPLSFHCGGAERLAKLSICAFCKRARDDTGYWKQIESYLRRHPNASFSHGYCPECAAKVCKEFGIGLPDIVRADIGAQNFE